MPRVGFVAIVGRPSSGKSTLLNAICGHKISIVSPTPQTTRNKIRGILTDERGQIVFLDTPGFHNSERKFNLHMREIVTESLNEVEAVLYLLDATRRPGEEESQLAEVLRSVSVPVVCAVNKVDHEDADPQAARSFLAEHLPADGAYATGASAGETPDAGAPPDGAQAIHEVSALSGTGLSQLTSALFSHLEEGEYYYPDEFYTDQDPGLRIAEIVREKAISQLKQEIPHALYVEISDMEMREARSGGAGRGGNPGAPGGGGGRDGGAGEHLWVRAFVTVERESQKGIVIGHGGERIRAVRIDSEAELAELFPYPVKLDLRVKVQPKWRTNDTLLSR
ncbi:MAG: GTPase Era, partial [Spirochaetota bacterium]